MQTVQLSNEEKEIHKDAVRILAAYSGRPLNFKLADSVGIPVFHTSSAIVQSAAARELTLLAMSSFVHLLGRDSTSIGMHLSSPWRAYIGLHTSKKTATPPLLSRTTREIEILRRQQVFQSLIGSGQVPSEPNDTPPLSFLRPRLSGHHVLLYCIYEAHTETGQVPPDASSVAAVVRMEALIPSPAACEKFLSSGERFGNDEELKTSVTRWFHSQVAEFYDRGIQKLIPRYDKCLNSDGCYIEK
ncbi:hypothetical protein ANN_20064 [Periplaneta americana]|uniref:Uncharacterized protein n=1 Tax=Periplaneta americana TaxID=6978 RepID=A0ABQ8SCP8_PERAM|nr:hypothetical protein ANN_20064 [Periplaneta americana]